MLVCQDVIFIILLLFGTTFGEAIRFGSVRAVPYLFNYTEEQDWCNPSFECDIISHLCSRIGQGQQQCTLKVFDSLEERITALENNEVDIVVGTFSVSPNRAERVNFVRPYYYSSGAKLFSLPGDKDLFNSFGELISQPICMDLGYYAGRTIIEEYGVFVFPSTQETVLELIKQGYCIATITDSSFILDGLVQTNVPTKYEIPYAVAISKTPKIQSLKNQVQNAILEMFVGNQSILQKLEEQYLLQNGIKRNLNLKQLSEAILSNGGEYIGAQEEDKIWNASSIAVTKRLSEELIHIDPIYDSICKTTLAEIYQSYNNGTPISKLPSIFIDSVAYTFINGFSDPQNMHQTGIVLQHPLIEPGTNSLQVEQTNPQIVLTTNGVQDAFLGDEKNSVEGAEFYTSSPFDGAQVMNQEDRVRVSLLSPTRVVKTFLFKNIQPKNKENDMLILAGCGVGELRNW